MCERSVTTYEQSAVQLDTQLVTQSASEPPSSPGRQAVAPSHATDSHYCLQGIDLWRNVAIVVKKTTRKLQEHLKKGKMGTRGSSVGPDWD